MPKPSRKQSSLNPCPFCGGEALLIGSRGLHQRSVGCEVCKVWMYRDTTEQVTVDWNIRVGEIVGGVAPGPDPRVELLQKQLKEAQADLERLRADSTFTSVKALAKPMEVKKPSKIKASEVTPVLDLDGLPQE